MSFHLEGPWLTTTGRWRTKRRKYASAEAARQERELRAEWEQRQREWSDLAPKFTNKRYEITKTARVGPQYPPGREPNNIPSRPDTPGAVASRPADKVYTGTKIKGIGTMHKSNAVPIFSDDEAQDIARMRR